jgi:hypothetical protein
MIPVIAAAIVGLASFFGIGKLMSSGKIAGTQKPGDFILVNADIVFSPTQPPKNGDAKTPVRMLVNTADAQGDVEASFADPRIDVQGSFPVSSKSIVGKTK